MTILRQQRGCVEECSWNRGGGGDLYLVTGGAARLQPLGVVPPAEDLPVLVEVDEVHQELAARAAHEAGRVPAHAVARPRCKHGDVAAVYLAPALRKGGGGRKEEKS